MIFISDVQYYVPIKLGKTAGNIHLVKITGTLKPENIKLNKNYIWDTLAIDCKEVSMTFNDKINLPRIVTIKLRDKIKIRLLDEEATTTLPHNAQTRNYMVHLDLGHTGNCIK